MTRQQDYRQPPELHKQWVEMANRLGAMVSKPPISGSEVAVAKQFVPACQVLMFHFGRSVRTFAAICRLLSHGFTQDAVVPDRTRPRRQRVKRSCDGAPILAIHNPAGSLQSGKRSIFEETKADEVPFRQASRNDHVTVVDDSVDRNGLICYSRAR